MPPLSAAAFRRVRRHPVGLLRHLDGAAVNHADAGCIGDEHLIRRRVHVDVGEAVPSGAAAEGSGVRDDPLSRNDRADPRIPPGNAVAPRPRLSAIGVAAAGQGGRAMYRDDAEASFRADQ